MQRTDTVAMLGVGTGDERILFRLTERALTAEVTREHWQRIEGQLQEQFDDGTLVGGVLAVGAARIVRFLKRWYLGPHDIAVADASFDGQVLRVERHGLGTLALRDRFCPENTWYAALDVVGGCWSEGFSPEDAQAFVERFRELREARMRTLAYAASVGGRVLAGAAAAGLLAAAIARTVRGPRRDA